MKRVVGIVSENERDEIRSLHSRRHALVELAQLLTKDNCEMYDKIVADLAETTFQFHEWWNRKAEQYQWEGSKNGHWSIDFENCLIYLIDD